MKFQVGDIVLDHNHTEPVTIAAINSGNQYPIQTSNGDTYTLEGRHRKNGPVVLTLVERPNKDYKVEQITTTSKLITLLMVLKFTIMATMPYFYLLKGS